MLDPVDPVDPVQSEAVPVSESGDSSLPSSTGLPSNIAAALACFPLVGGIIFYLLEKRDSFVRFYAMQSIIFGGAWILFAIVSNVAHNILRSIPGIGRALAALWSLAAAFVDVAFLVVLVIAIVKAFSGDRWDIPWVGPLARKQTRTSSL